MPRNEFTVTFDERGNSREANSLNPPGGNPPVRPPLGQGKPKPEGTVEEVVSVVLVRTSGNSPGCCWWIMIGGRWYCMPVQC